MIKALSKLAYAIVSFWAYVYWVLWVLWLKIKKPGPLPPYKEPGSR